MYPSLQDGDRILILRHWPTAWLRKGQIVVGSLSQLNKPRKFPGSLENTEKLFVKRIASLAGETIISHISELPEHLRSDQNLFYDSRGCRVWLIPPRHIFVLGDNTLYSHDSRLWDPVPVHTLLGIAIMKLPYKVTKQSAGQFVIHEE